MSWTNAVITDAGHRLQAALLGTGKGLVFTRAVTGAGLTEGELAAQTAVTDERQTLSLQPATPLEDAKTKVQALLSNAGLETGYTMHQLGFYAKAQDEEDEILYALVQDETGDTIPADAESPGFTSDWSYVFAYGNADSVTVMVDPAGMITWDKAGAAGGVAPLGPDGKVPEENLPEMEYDPSGSAAAVQSNLDTHVADQGNPHSVTAAQVGAYTKEETLTAETKEQLGLDANAVPDDAFKQLAASSDGWKFRIITKSKNFVVPTNIVGKAHALLFGGGGGGAGYYGGGGGGGYLEEFDVELTPGGTYPVVIGAGGAGGSGSSPGTNGGNGGNTTFAGHSASGGGGGKTDANGGAGGNGGSGGGAYDGNGGNGQYGGGGGGVASGKGGNGGTYGGGGGSGNNGVTGGSKGTYGGAGGNKGVNGNDGTPITEYDFAYPWFYILASFLNFEGSALGKGGTTSSTSYGGAGGGGYGGNGGHVSSQGSGGGGYGGNGGSSTNQNGSGGGGGGGYGCNGKDGGRYNGGGGGGGCFSLGASGGTGAYQARSGESGESGVAIIFWRES